MSIIITVNQACLLAENTLDQSVKLLDYYRLILFAPKKSRVYLALFFKFTNLTYKIAIYFLMESDYDYWLLIWQWFFLEINERTIVLRIYILDSIWSTPSTFIITNSFYLLQPFFSSFTFISSTPTHSSFTYTKRRNQNMLYFAAIFLLCIASI